MTIAAEYLEHVRIPKGQLLFKEGDQSYFFFIVQQGQVEVFTQDQSGKKITLAIVEPGHAIGEFAMVTKNPRSASAMALTDVELVKITEEGYQNLLKDLPDWALSMIQSLVERLTHADQTIRKHSIENAQLKSALNTIVNGDLKS